MIAPKDKICVAVSGGKDSMSLLYILSKKWKVAALCIDEGIAGYREKTLKHLKDFCSKNKITLRVVSFEKETGMTLDVKLKAGRSHDLMVKSPLMKTSNNACTVCGTMRRTLLNKYAQRFDKLATGHNLDDEAQTVIMNLATYKPELMRGQKPVSPKAKGFVQRIKPFCMLTEKQVMLYAVLNNLQPPFVECPYMHEALRDDVRDALNVYEQQHPGAKRNVYEAHLALVHDK
jgi:tRNA(Ile)-lysidine synthase TilS/MesJ